MSSGFYRFNCWMENWDGPFLRQSRCMKRITQRRLAELTNIPQPHIVAMESGDLPIDKEMARRLGMALDVSYDDPFDEIQKALGVHRLSDRAKEDLRNAHKHFAADMTIDLSRPSRSTARLRLIEKHSKALIAAITDIDDLSEQYILSRSVKPQSTSIHDLQRELTRLHTRVSIAIEKMPRDRRGPNQDVWPLRTLVARLKTIYEKATGGKATLIKAKGSSPRRDRRRTPKKNTRQNEPRGPFFRFVKTFLGIIGHEVWSDIALARAIEQAIYPSNSPQKS